MRIKILNKFWDLVFVPQLYSQEGMKTLGQCDPPDTPNKKIKVLKSLKGQERLEVLIHEMLHAADWYKDESWIEQIAHDIAHALHKLGYEDGGEISKKDG
jgi:hypothetical protein